MKVAHIILVHKEPAQVARLLMAVQHPLTDCWVHVDKKMNVDEFKKAAAPDSAYWIEQRTAIDWGRFNMVKAMCVCLQQVLASGIKYEYINFLSGQDYPVKPPALFYEFLMKGDKTEYAGSIPFNTRTQDTVRISNYYFNRLKTPFKELAERLVNKIMPARKFPYNDMEIRKGSQWITVTAGAAGYILDFVKQHPKFVRYFMLTHAPDEYFFHTILYNSPFKNTISDFYVHYTNWSEQAKSPKTLTAADFKAVIHSPHFFARKFDSSVDTVILDLLDKEINGGQPLVQP